MNLFEYDFGRRCLVGEGWCPTLQIDEVRLALRTGSVSLFSSLFLSF